MSTIHHDGELHFPGTSPGLEGLQSGPHRAAGVDHVIDQHHKASIHAFWEGGGLHQSCSHPRQIIPVKSGIQAAMGNGVSCNGTEPLGEHLGQGHPPGGDPQKQQVFSLCGRLQHLGRQAIQGASQFLRGEDFDAGARLGSGMGQADRSAVG